MSAIYEPRFGGSRTAPPHAPPHKRKACNGPAGAGTRTVVVASLPGIVAFPWRMGASVHVGGARVLRSHTGNACYMQMHMYM